MLEMQISKQVEVRVSALTHYAKDLVISNAEEAEEAGIELAKLSVTKKQIEAQRKEFTKPLNDSLKSINRFFKQFSEPLKNIDYQIRSQVKNFGVENETNDMGTVILKNKQVVSVEDQSLVPVEYLMVNLPKVKAELKAGGTVPGIKVVEEKVVSL